MSDIALPAIAAPKRPLAERLLGDERLAKLVSRGNAGAFAALYERHHQALYRYCRSILHNDHDAQDALQNAMMSAFSALRRSERDIAVRPWLFRIAHNEAISVLRRRGPHAELSEHLEQPGGGLEATIDTRQRLQALVSDLQSLPERQRAALLMRELSGLSIQEIAAALSISQGVAKQTLFEARGSLHDLEQGRAMQCEQVRAAISQHDGRVLRGKRIRAHLRACEDCQAFRAAIGQRETELRAIAPPLPAAAATALLAKLLAHGGTAQTSALVGAGAGGGAAGGATASGVSGGVSIGGHALAASAIGKAVAGVAVLAAATAATVHVTSAGHRAGTARHGGAASLSRAAAPAGGAHAAVTPKTGAEQNKGGSQGAAVSANTQASSQRSPAAANPPASATASRPTSGQPQRTAPAARNQTRHAEAQQPAAHRRGTSAPSSSSHRHGASHRRSSAHRHSATRPHPVRSHSQPRSGSHAPGARKPPQSSSSEGSQEATRPSQTREGTSSSATTTGSQRSS